MLKLNRINRIVLSCQQSVLDCRDCYNIHRHNHNVATEKNVQNCNDEGPKGGRSKKYFTSGFSEGKEKYFKRMKNTRLLEEKDVGITEYVGSLDGFSGIIKSRCFDFQVNEIDSEGNVAKLTDTSAPKIELVHPMDERSASQLEVMNLIGKDIWDKLLELSANADIEMTADWMTKEQVDLVQSVVMETFGAAIVISTVIDKDGKLRIKFGRSSENKMPWLWPAEYTHFVLSKVNVDTTTVVNSFAQGLNCDPATISLSGMKDKRGVTTQWFCIKNAEPKDILKIVSTTKSVAAGNFTFKNKQLTLGRLRGNRFRIAIRFISEPEAHIERSLEHLKEYGFINYFGLQRFGTNLETPAYKIGLAILKRQYMEACDHILKPGAQAQAYHTKMWKHWKKHRDPTAALKIFGDKNGYRIEANLLNALIQHGASESLHALPAHLLRMYAQAYQSLVFNEMASKRIKLKLQLLPGDLVLLDGDEAQECEEKSEETEENEPPNKTKSVKILTEDDIASGAYTIFDLILPLPGSEVPIPPTVMGQWIIDRFAQDGLSMQDIVAYSETTSFKGTYRKLIVKPFDMLWYFMKHRTAEADLIRTDLHELIGREQPKSDDDGQFKSLILDFCLPKSTYATMMLRELSKQDTSNSSQLGMEMKILADSREKFKNETLAADKETIEMSFASKLFTFLRKQITNWKKSA